MKAGGSMGADPGVVEQAGNLLVAEEGEDLSGGAGRDAEVVEEQPLGAAVGGATGGRGGGYPIRQTRT